MSKKRVMAEKKTVNILGSFPREDKKGEEKYGRKKNCEYFGKLS